MMVLRTICVSLWAAAAVAIIAPAAEPKLKGKPLSANQWVKLDSAKVGARWIRRSSMAPRASAS